LGRKAKLSKDERLRLVKEYLDGSKSVRELADESGYDYNHISRLIKHYKSLGESAFEEKPRNKAYSKELKLQAVQDYLDGKGSLEDISIKYGIMYHSILINWIKKYNSHIEIKEYNPKGEVYMTKSRKTTYGERLEIVRHCLNNKKEYKITAEHYNLPYNLVYQWVKKYEEEGEAGLEDRRGRRKEEQELSEEDKLKRQIALLEANNKRLLMENEVLKKFQDVERRMISAELSKKRNTK
jgi:transposase-like protein